MDERHSPIPMKGVVADEGRKIIGYIYYDQTKWSLNPGSAFVITDIADEPILWLNISGLGTDAIASAAGNNANIEQVNSAKKDIQAFVGQAKKERLLNYCSV